MHLDDFQLFPVRHQRDQKYRFYIKKIYTVVLILRWAVPVKAAVKFSSASVRTHGHSPEWIRVPFELWQNKQSSIPKRCQEGHICAKHLWALFLDISPDPSSSLQYVRLRCAEVSDSWAFIKAVHFKQLSARCTQQIFSSSCTSFQQSRHVRTTGVACPAHRLAQSPTASSGPQTGALAPTAVARVSPPAPQTGTGLVACRLRPGCAKSGRARLCCRGSEGCSRSVHNQHTISSSHWFHCSNTCLNTILFKVPPKNLSFTNSFDNVLHFWAATVHHFGIHMVLSLTTAFLQISEIFQYLVKAHVTA